MTEVNDTLTLDKAAAMLGISTEALRSRVRRGQVTPISGTGGQGRPLLFARAEVQRVQDRPDVEAFARVLAGFLSGRIGPSMLYYFKPQPAGRDTRGQVVARSYHDREAAFNDAVPPLQDVPPTVLDAARRICATLNRSEVEYIHALLFAALRLPPEKPIDADTKTALDALRGALFHRPDIFRLFNETLYSFDARAVRYLLDGHLEKYLPPEKLPKENFKPLMPDLDEEKAAKYSVALVRWARRGQNRYRRFFSSKKRGIESNRVRRFDKISGYELADLLNISHMTAYRLRRIARVHGALTRIKRLAGFQDQKRHEARRDSEVCPDCDGPITAEMDCCPICGLNLYLPKPVLEFDKYVEAEMDRKAREATKTDTKHKGSGGFAPVRLR